eukprot:15323940-Ditylum_brightwellii.AAC.3
MENFQTIKWATKWASERIPTGTKMQDRGTLPIAECPRCCGEEMGTPNHICTCPKANILWRELQDIMAKWAANNNTVPGLVAAILASIHQWHQHETPILNTSRAHNIRNAFNA